MTNRERLVLVDGSSLIFRAFFAIPSNFTTRQGLHTNAIYGFATMFRKLLSGRTPDRGAVIFDAPGKTFREEKYSAYKAQRPRMPWELKEQLPWIDRVVEAHRFVHLRAPGYEADDVIGTLSRQGKEAGMEIVIVSGDKDFAQLIDDDIRMLDTLRDVTYDAELVYKKWGARPEHIVDLLALMGDKVDNIPGVPGVGQKGAAKLLETYGSLDRILESLDELKGRQRQNLEEYQDSARLSKELATIDQHVPLEITLEDLVYQPPSQADLNELYRELEFYSLLSEEARAERDSEALGEAEYELVEDSEQLASHIAEIDPQQTVAICPLYEQPSPIEGALVGIAFSASPGAAFYVPWNDRTKPRLADLFADPERKLVAHNVKELWQLLHREGIDLRGVVGDTMLASFLIEPTKLIPHRLDQVVREHLHRTISPLKSLIGSGQKEVAVGELPPADAARFACHWADPIGQLWPMLATELKTQGQTENLEAVDLPLCFVLGQMELDGIRVDEEDLGRLGVELREQLAETEARVHALAGHEFNIASTKQLSKVLFEELELPVIKKTKTGYSTNQEVLERLAPKHEIARQLLDHRRISKLINTYTDVLQRSVSPRTGRVHATFQQTVGATGRLISTDPDLQRTPVKTSEGRRIRQAFIADPGHSIISADWSQIELRVLAHASRDPILVEAFAENLDIHRRTACELFGCKMDDVSKAQRDIAKTINFATIYGQGATALAQILGIPRKEAQQYIEGYFETYAGVRSWLDETIERAHETGYVTTLLGRRRYIPELSSNNYIDRAAGERIAANTPIQGSAADICKLAMLQIARELETRELQTKMLLQIHDELVFECPSGETEEAVALIRDRMEHVYPLSVPLVVGVGVGPSWGDAH